MNRHVFSASGVLFLCFSAMAFAGFSVVNCHVNTDTVNGIANFAVTFDRTPDFHTLNSAGVQADSFQYYIDLDKSPSFPGPSNIEMVFRGDEIHIHDAIVIRDVFTLVPTEPYSGGYGPIIGMTDYNLVGNQLSFSVDLDAISSPNGQFSYALMCTEYGAMTDWVYSNGISVIPAPSAIVLAAIGISAVFLKKKSKFSRQS